MARKLFVSLCPVLSGSLVTELFDKISVDIRETDFMMYHEAASTSFQQKYASAIVLADRLDAVSPKVVELLTACLQPGSVVSLFGVNETSGAELSRSLLLSGLVEVTLEATPSTSYCKTQAQAKTPGWSLGAKAALSLKPKQSTQPAAAKWTLAADDQDDELIDEEELLTEEDLKRPAPVKQDDCEVGAGRKACKNCTCGRAEAEADAVKLTPEMLQNAESACGNCFLGDAFRCASCPYRGLPAFEKGQKVQLPSNFLTADV